MCCSGTCCSGTSSDSIESVNTLSKLPRQILSPRMVVRGFIAQRPATEGSEVERRAGYLTVHGGDNWALSSSPRRFVQGSQDGRFDRDGSTGTGR